MRKTSMVLIGFLCFLMSSTVFFNVDIVYGFHANKAPYPDKDSSDAYGHNRIVWNALELLRRDGYAIEAELIDYYNQNVQEGLHDCDAGSAANGWKYSGVPLIDTQMHVMLETRNLGGFSHYFDAWDHHGIGLAEDMELLLTLLPLGEILYLLGEPWTILCLTERPDEVASIFYRWKDWQGANAAESARRNFNRAVQAWEVGDEEKAMYYLGYALHLLGDSASPFHASHTMGSGHSDFEGDWIDQDLKENPDYYKVDRTPDLSSGFTQFSQRDTLDHGIYLQDLYSLSDGIYIAGDPNLVDTESSPDALRYGHITQLSDPIYQFIDFAAHEAIEWYPLVNSEKGETIDFNDWWEIWNYIETRKDLKMKTEDSSHVPFTSSLIFHFEGMDWIDIQFEGSWENEDAIDMENWVYQNLGRVDVYEDYARSDPIASFTDSIGSLIWGPEVFTRTSTIAVDTIVDRWGGWRDHDCDGWQLNKIYGEDLHGPNDYINDPLLSPPDTYKRTDGTLHPLPLLDDPLPEQEPAKRVVAVHQVDLASKLCAGVIKHFFDAVKLPRGPPETSLIPVFVPGHYPPSYQIAQYTHIDEYGRLYSASRHFMLEATSYRTVYSATEGGWIQEGTGDGILAIVWRIDGGQWLTKVWLDHDHYRETVEFDIPSDELPHTIQYYSINHHGEMEPMHTKVVIWDPTAPTISIEVGEPKKLDGIGTYQLCITQDTPIHITVLDQGSGGNHTFVQLYVTPNTPLPPYDTLPLEWLWTQCCGPPQWAFTLNELVEQGISPTRFPSTETFLRIVAEGYDNVRNFCVAPETHLYVVPFIEGVDVSIDPQRATVQPGSSVDYTIFIRNRYQTPQTYDLTLEGLDPTWCTLPQTSIMIDPDETENVTLTVSPPYVGQIMKVYPFTVIATLQGSSDVSDSADALLGLVYQPELPPHPAGEVEVAVVPDVIGTPAGTTAEADIGVSNSMNFDDLIRVRIEIEDIPEQYQADPAWFSWTSRVLFVPAGTRMILPLKITIPAAGFDEYKAFDATATPAARPIAQAVARARIIVDGTPPSTTLHIDSPKYVNDGGDVYVTSDTPFELTATDNDVGSGVANTRYRIHNTIYDSGWMISAPPVAFQLTELEDGIHNIDFYSTDNAGNIESTNTKTIILDNTPPTITITSPIAGDYSHSHALVIDFDVTDEWSGVASVTAELDGSPVNDGDVIDLAALALNSHTLTITATDNLGHATTASVTFSVVSDVDSLIDLVERFYENGQIGDAEVRDGLLDKLCAAKALIEAGKTGPARNLLLAFIREVKAQRGHYITEEEANVLLADAEYAIEHL